MSNIDKMDEAKSGYEKQLGNYFLRTSPPSETRGGDVLLVSYVTPVKKVSGELWDIDCNLAGDYEKWRLEALDANQQVVTNITSPRGVYFTDPSSLDASPWPFEIDVVHT
jgi:hypothetical protein